MIATTTMTMMRTTMMLWRAQIFHSVVRLNWTSVLSFNPLLATSGGFVCLVQRTHWTPGQTAQLMESTISTWKAVHRPWKDRQHCMYVCVSK